MKLATRIISTILLALMLVLALFAWIDVAKERKLLDASLERQGDALVQIIGTFSVDSLLVEDYPVLESALTSIGLSNKGILTIDVLHDGQSVASYRKGGSVEGRAFRSAILLQSLDDSENRPLGEVRLVLSEENNEALHFSSLKDIGVFFVVVFIVLLTLLTYILRRQVLSRIITLNEYATSITPDHFDAVNGTYGAETGLSDITRDPNGSKDEIDQLSQSLEVMYNAVTERETLLRQYSKNLEREVELRVKDLKIAKEQAESSDRAKGLFLANISHEIRTPMNGIVGFARLLERTPLEATQVEYLNSISQSVSALQRVIDGILDYSRIEAGPVALEKEHFNLYQLLDEVVGQYATAALEKGLQLIHGISRNLNPEVEGDRKHLKLILVHLVENAVKFTDEGYVSIWVELDSQPASKSLRFLVEDTGVGIELEKQQGLFEAFSQGDTSMSRRHGGSGLGLAIVNQLVKAMDGQVGLRSHLGTGSNFWFTAPYRPNNAISAAHAQRSDLAGKEVLICDHNAMSRRAYRHTLLRAGFLVHDWQGDCHALLDKPYDMILSVLTGSDWQDELLEIRGRLPFTQAAVFLVNHPDPSNALKSEMPNLTLLASTLDGYELLYGRLSSFLLGGAEVDDNSNVAMVSAAHDDGGIAVLLIDDNRISALLVQALLLEQGAQVSLAHNAEEALAEMGAKQFDLVLIDTAMQGDGSFVLIDRIRRDEVGKRTTPIVAITSQACVDGSRPFVERGIDDHILKPVEESQLVGVIAKWVSVATSIE